MELTAANVKSVMLDCLFKEGENVETAVIAEGVVSTFGFNPERLAAHAAEIRSMLEQLPEVFQPGTGDGYSFLGACNRADGRQWGEHRDMEALFAMGVASGSAKCLLPREVWSALPGGMPYYGVTRPAAAIEIEA